MKIIDIEIENKIIIKFIYKDKPYNMIVDVITKNNKYIIIPSILENNQVLSPNSISDVMIIYTVNDGIYQFESTNIETAMYEGMRVYHVSSDEEVLRLNRREAYRVFIGDVIKINLTAKDGTTKDIVGVLRDVSIFGMGIILRKELEIGTAMSAIHNYEGLNLHLQGNVVRKEVIEKYNAFIYGCKFDEFNNGVNRIIFQKRIKSRNKSKSINKSEDN